MMIEQKGPEEMKLFFKKDCRGITLIELMVAMVIGAILLAGLFTAFLSQHRSYTVQDQISTVQQSVRAGMSLMVQEIRMAGFNPRLCPCVDSTADTWFGILAASEDSITISADLNEDGSLNQGEAVTYSIGDFDGDGDDDLLRQEVNVTGTDAERQLVIENVVNGVTGIAGPLFRYEILADGRLDDIGSGLASVMDGVDNDGDGDTDRDDTDGEILETIDPDNHPIGGLGPKNDGDLNGDLTKNAADRQFFRDAIRDVIITLVVRTEMEDPGYPGGLNIRGTAADGTCRTRTLRARVRLRNLGLVLAPGRAVVWPISSGT
jgi:type IV pilus assembly protein PilW